MVGCFVAIVVVKMLFGGIGKNFANPAITARVVLLVSFSAAMGDASAFVTPSFADGNISHIAGATPLGAINATQVSGLGEIGNMAWVLRKVFLMCLSCCLALRGGSLGRDLHYHPADRRNLSDL